MRIFVQTKEPSDFAPMTYVKYLDNSFSVHEDHFKLFTTNSLIVMDNFSFKKANNKQEKIDFLKVINYNLQHKKITLILIVHN